MWCHQLPPTGPLLLCMVAPGTWDVLGFGDQVVNVKLGVSPLHVQDTWG